MLWPVLSSLPLGSRNLPGRRSRKQAEAALAALLLAFAGCGGHSETQAVPRTVAGTGFRFSAPSGWHVEVRARSSSASPKPGATELVSVSTFRLVREYRPELWTTAVAELDRVAGELASRLGGRVGATRTVVVDGRRARQYELDYTRDGKSLAQQITFVLAGRREYQLVCRWESSQSDAMRAPCAQLVSSFRRA
jgi:hypothetical protein